MLKLDREGNPTETISLYNQSFVIISYIKTP